MTAAAAKALAAIAERGGACGSNRTQGNLGIVHDGAASALVARGYAIRDGIHPDGGTLYRITEAGRAALAAHERRHWR